MVLGDFGDGLVLGGKLLVIRLFFARVQALQVSVNGSIGLLIQLRLIFCALNFLGKFLWRLPAPLS